MQQDFLRMITSSFETIVAYLCLAFPRKKKKMDNEQTEDLVAGPCATELGMQGEYRCARVSVSELVSAGVLTDATYCFITVMIFSDSVNELKLRLI